MDLTISVLPKKFLSIFDAHMIFTMEEQPLDFVSFIQWNKQKRHIYEILQQKSLQVGFCDFMEVTKITCLPLYPLSKNSFLHRNWHITHNLKRKL